MKDSFKTLDLNDCFLKKTRIDIWQFPLHSEFPEAIGLLAEDEVKRANRYYFPRHKRRFTIARAMLRLILSRYCNASAAQLVFDQGHHGKPFLLGAPQLQFNLSHSEDMALLAVGSEFQLGIDLECFAGRPYEGIGRQMFSNAENQALFNTPPPLKPLAFFHLWAQKEALIKACGLGLSYPTQQFDVPALPSTDQLIVDSLHDKIWKMVSFQPHVSCCAALCHEPEVTEIRYVSISAQLKFGQGE